MNVFKTFKVISYIWHICIVLMDDMLMFLFFLDLDSLQSFSEDMQHNSGPADNFADSQLVRNLS